ncbi:hypothetical protein HYDPIDRAFT_114591 [Hydnomerulius pinastri MD-312]|uniref:Uncharacterized protein n=1 Tax=Hydnomerulius pinastri MD-312 TaxID=994086 RepID=A0A0C9V9U6_9AGAM|nr:hypothetical protein HYDPIDRAFT_114591 [Hydnomerulius pinastri MD-312]
MHKRKHRKSAPEDWESSARASTSRFQLIASADEDDGTSTSDPALYIQAHEADIVRGPQSVHAARSLECPDASTTGSNDAPQPGSGLIRWGAQENSLDFDGEPIVPQESKQSPLWVDRYDVRLLLDTLPERDVGPSQVRPLSPSGWSDLPSDSEDTFFFSPDELEDYRRDKRRRLIDRGREERLKALAAAEGEEEDPDLWGGSDEEPDEVQKELLRRTASHIISSPNPAQLEMRILANYGTDKRFAFLRGRWSRAWRVEKERARQQAEEAKKVRPVPSKTVLGGLVGYGDSDDSSSDAADEAVAEHAPNTSSLQTQQEDANIVEDAQKEARRAKAREWVARHRAEQALPSEQT